MDAWAKTLLFVNIFMMLTLVIYIKGLITALQNYQDFLRQATKTNQKITDAICKVGKSVASEVTIFTDCLKEIDARQNKED